MLREGKTEEDVDWTPEVLKEFYRKPKEELDASKAGPGKAIWPPELEDSRELRPSN